MEEVQAVSANRSDLDAFPRGDVDVFLAPLSAFSSGCSSRFVLRFSLALNTSLISFFSFFNLSDARLSFIKRLVAFVSTDEQFAVL